MTSGGRGVISMTQYSILSCNHSGFLDDLWGRGVISMTQYSILSCNHSGFLDDLWGRGACEVIVSFLLTLLTVSGTAPALGTIVSLSCLAASERRSLDIGLHLIVSPNLRHNILCIDLTMLRPSEVLSTRNVCLSIYSVVCSSGLGHGPGILVVTLLHLVVLQYEVFHLAILFQAC